MKNAVITGSLSGLAQAVIKQLLNKGYRVFEGDLAIKEETIRGNEYLFPLDLTSDESILNFYKKVTNYTDKVDVITNFAGIVILGSFVVQINLSLESLYKNTSNSSPIFTSAGTCFLGSSTLSSSFSAR